MEKDNSFILYQAKKRQIMLMLILWILIVSFLSLGNLACLGTTENKLNTENLYRIRGLEFKSQSIPNDTNAAFNFYIKNGDEIFPIWNSFKIIITEEENAMCSFDMLENTEDCIVGELCSEESNLEIVPNEDRSGFSMNIVFFPDFMRSSEPELISTFPAITPVSGCDQLNRTPTVFTPQKNGLFRISSSYSKPENHQGITNGEININIVGTDQTPKQTITYDLTKQRVNSIDYWTWEMPDAEVWEDNFSKNLRIEKVRIINGNETIRPSKVFFLPNYNGTIVGNLDNANECYSNANTQEDDSIFFDDCKKSPTVSANTDPIKNLTPTYDHLLTGDKLTWFAEFNTSQGGDDATSISDLKIEFTLEAVN